MAREWCGIQQFPHATKTKLLELVGKLIKKESVSFTILVMGKDGVGKSSTVNSILGEPAVAVNGFMSDVARPEMVSREFSGFTLNIIDTPGIAEGGYVNNQAFDLIKTSTLETDFVNGTAWIPNILEVIAQVANNKRKSIEVDQKLIDGPNANGREKVFTLLIIALQVFVGKQVQKWINDDIAKELKP